jgi:GTP pyrophosphokinase
VISSRSSPPHHTPSKDWLKIAKSTRARNKIRAWIKTEERKRSIGLGREICEKEFRRYNLNLGKLQKSGEIKKVAVEFGFVGEEDLMAAVGYGKLSCNQILGKLLPEQKLEEHRERRETRLSKVVDKLTRKSSSAIQISGVNDVLVRFGKCCNPVPETTSLFYYPRSGVFHAVVDCPISMANDPNGASGLPGTG